MRAIVGIILLVLGLLPAMATAQRLDEVRRPDGRFYLIARPAGVPAPPLILALHGGGGSPAQFARDAGLTGPALAVGFAVAYPAGTSRAGGPFLVWNGGGCCGHAVAAGVDDVGFLARVAADAQGRFGLRAGPVYLTGMSNGAIMAQRFAAERPGAVAAVASVAGTLDTARWPPRGAVPVLHIHGTRDDHVPVEGGRGARSIAGVAFPPLAGMIDAFRRPHGGLARSEAVIDRVDDGMRTRVTRWTDAAGRPRMVLMLVEGGGHDWPGGQRAGRRGGTRDISAPQEALSFFARHR